MKKCINPLITNAISTINVLNLSTFSITMNNIFRGLIAGVGAKKLGGGCISTVFIFIVIWVVLGYCN